MTDLISNASVSKVDIRIHQKRYPVLSMRGCESLFSPFRFDIRISLDQSSYKKSWLMESAELHFPARVIYGVISEEEVEYYYEEDRIELNLTLRPRYALLELQSSANIYLNKTIPDIIKNILIEIGYDESQIRLFLNKSYPSQPFVFQPPLESDLDFIKRIASVNGLFFFSQMSGSNEIICLSDNDQAFQNAHSLQISYTSPSNLPSQNSSQGFYRLSMGERAIPDFFRVTDYTEQNPTMKIDQSFGMNDSLNSQQLFGLGCCSNLEAKELAEYFFNANEITQDINFGESHRSDLASGLIFILETEQWNNMEESNQNYLVTEMNHWIDQPVGPHGEGCVTMYRNETFFVDAKKTFQWIPECSPVMPKLMGGHIESNSRYAELDSLGKYYNKMQLDRSSFAYTLSMPNVRRLSPFGAKQGEEETSGFHLPLNDRAEILYGFLYGNPNRPIIMGALYNQMQQSPVTQSNSQENIIRTAANNELNLSDSESHSSISIKNHNEINLIKLSAIFDNYALLISTQGELISSACNNINVKIGNNCVENISKNYIQSALKNISIGTLEDHLNLMIENDQFLKAQADVTFSSENLIFNSASQWDLFAHQNGEINVLSQDLQSVSKTLIFESEKRLSIIGSGQENIKIVSGNASIEITQSGVININAEEIVVSGQPVFSVEPTYITL